MQQAPEGVQQGPSVKQGDQSGPAQERRERADRAPRGNRRERGSRDRPPRPAPATAAGNAPDSGEKFWLHSVTCRTP